MVRGGPDFGAVAPRVLTAPVLDLGELAVRLHSPVIFDRLGTVVAIVTGGRLGPPATTVSGPTARVDLWAGLAFIEGYSLRLFTSDATDQAETLTEVPFLGDTGVGVEAIWSQRTDGAANFELTASVDDGTDGLLGALRFNESTNNWQFFDSSGTWADTPTQPRDPTVPAWRSSKVTIDPSAGTYLRVVVDGQDTGLRGTAARVLTSTARRIFGRARLVGIAAGDTDVFLSHMIYTVNEE